MRRVTFSPLRLTAAIFISGLVLWRFLFFHGDVDTKTSGRLLIASKPDCSSLPLANETLVILKTGSTELQEKLPVHLRTTTKCYPYSIIFSDYEEDYQQEHIFDALESVDTDIQDNHPDFALYRQLKQQGRKGVIASGVGKGGTVISWTGNSDNPGWKLDKWKFLPMVKRTLQEYPDMKWYMFAEVDTYILWVSLLQYLSVLDPTASIYMGSQMYIGPDLFAHGGSGFVMSQSAMRTLVSYYESHQRELDNFTDGHWAGDCVLGKALRDAGVKFRNAWPITQGDYPGIVPYARPDGRPVANPNVRVWCYPVVTYHHVSPETIEDLWNFEQRWIKERMSTDGFLRHKDMFSQYILPRMSETPASSWDNESDKEDKEVSSFDACRESCQRDPSCRQYSFEEGAGLCRTREDPRLGLSKAGFRSGWLLDRMEEFRDSMARCNDEGWLI